MVSQYNLVHGIFGIARVISKLSIIMLLRKIKDYLYENSPLIITVLANLRKIYKFDLLSSSRTLLLNFPGKAGYPTYLYKKLSIGCVSVCHSVGMCSTQQTLSLKIFSKTFFHLLGTKGFI